MTAQRPADALTGEDAPRPRDTTVTEDVDGEAIVYLEETGALHVLNPTATLIWQHLDGQVSVDELAASLSDASGAPLDVVQADVLQAVRSFGAAGLLDGVQGSPVQPTVPPSGAAQGHTIPQGDDARFLPEPPHG